MRNLSLVVAALLLLGDRPRGTTSRLLPRPLPHPRGGSTAVAKNEKKRRRRDADVEIVGFWTAEGPNPLQVAANHTARGLGRVGGKIRRDAAGLGENAGREWTKLASGTRRFVAAGLPRPPRLRLPFLPRRGSAQCRKLDDVCRTFSSVIRSGGEVDTARLLRACRAHVVLMKTGGSSLRLVARDYEGNVKKAERAYRASRKESGCASLASLLESERERGAHRGSELGERSGAMGLLWIRRSLQFQSELYASLARGEVRPRDAAREAYDRHLSPYHGWALRRVFPASLSAMPEREAFLAKFAGVEADELDDERVRTVAKKLRSLVATWDPLLGAWRGEYERLGLEDTRRV
ncbi:hypothetical protein ACHAWF_004914 [Thalassiosira exigua]